MEIELLLKDTEETLEQKIDRINTAVQNTIQEIDGTGESLMNQSRFSNLHSYTTSYCHFEWLDNENETSVDIKLPEGIEETLENVLQALDRNQMLVEDFWAENLRNTQLGKSKNEELEAYISKIERENRDLRNGEGSGRKNVILNLKRNFELEKERRNFEEKLVNLDVLTETYKLKHKHISELQENLMIKESLLEQKENELRCAKFEFEKKKQAWEQSIVLNTIKKSNFKNSGKCLGLDMAVEEAPPPSLVMTPNRANQISDLQQLLKLEENKFKSLGPGERSRAITTIDQIKNKIAGLRGEQAICDSARSSRLIQSMRRTVESEVSHEENLRKINLERFTIKSHQKTCEKYSATPHSYSSNRFLFSDD